MKLSDFDYELPEDQIAQRPVRPRSRSRLFFLGKDQRKHLTFNEIVSLLREGDVMVKNKSKVVPARLEGRKDTGGRIELLFHRSLEEGWECLIKGSNIQEGRSIIIHGEEFEIVENRHEGLFVIGIDDENVVSLMEHHGDMPTPPYIKEDLEVDDEYQTVYAENEGSVAAPTAGLHFTEELLNKIEEKGVEVHDITLHVGPATFLPVNEEEVEDHEMGDEYFEVGGETAEAITEANEDGRRVIFVGTTTVRAVESASEDGVVEPNSGWTDLFIYPEYEFQSGMDLLLTNFHLPRSTLLMLVSAFTGKERILSAYREAVERGYRFYSFGDAMLLEGYDG
ncbi:MAG: tRNA preQ1(34) S-adenosylmethionine ribosyltransferase-isomerase QueA [Candidatus Aenigmatarchaeota archaeon]